MKNAILWDVMSCGSCNVPEDRILHTQNAYFIWRFSTVGAILRLNAINTALCPIFILQNGKALLYSSYFPIKVVSMCKQLCDK
jgi:hypothetical protein